MSFQFENYYPDPIKEADLVLEMLKKVDPGCIKNTIENDSTQEYEAFNDWIKEIQEVKRNLPYIEKFFSKILLPGGIESELIHIWGIDEIIDGQKAIWPISSMQNGSEIFQFASWTGDSGDGDAWCVDLKYSEIICIPVSTDCSSEGEARLNSYANLPNFTYFAGYLAASLLRRGWVESVTLTATKRT